MPRVQINRVVLIGRLTRDPELRALPAGSNVCGLRIACNSARREPDGSWSERPNYFDVSVFGAAADNVSQYLRRGRQVGIDGRLDWREWETAEGQKRQSVSIIADSVQFLDGPGDAEQGDDDGDLVGAGVEEDLSF
jgi:single-strand DNA-binding protein